MSKPIVRIIALVLGLTAASAVSADTYFETGRTLESSGILDLGLITAEDNGIVEIYDYHAGTIGDLLGAEAVHAGANPDVRVDTGLPVAGNIIAVVKIDGRVAAEKTFEVR